MEISEFSLRIIFLFVPGIISLLIIEKLSFHKEYKLFQILIYSLIIGFANYSFYYAILKAVNCIFHKSHSCAFFNALINNSAKIDFGEIAVVSLLAVPTGYIITALINFKVLNKLGKFLRVTKKFGDLDVWSYIMNSKNIEWVIIRDHETGLMYEGWIELFSDSTEQDELLLRDVIVFNNSTGKELYKTPGLYFPKKRENITIEFPELEYSEFINRTNKKEHKNG
jgi:hypothetical protein